MKLLKDPSLFREAFYSDGQWHTRGTDVIEIANPATGDVIGTVPKATLEDTRAAIAAAEAAFPDWAARPAKERSAIMRRWFELIVENADDLGRILTIEQGKPFPEARGEILYGAAFFEWFAEDAKRISGETIPAPTRDKRMLVLRQPIGVCAAITPWNFPMAMIPRKAGPAIAAGCTMVLKPASATPFSALALAELGERAGLPKGVFNVLTGSASVVGNELATNPAVRKITFTGSTEVGRELMAKAAGTIKKVALELGGNAPLIVFDDASLETAVQGALASKFRNMGQTCVCANRIYVQDGIYDAFVERFAELVSQMKVGNGMEEGVIQGPLIDEAAVAKVEEHVRDAVSGGARVVTGGKRHALGGTFYEPTVIADAQQSMKIANEETFGPVAPIFRFKEEKEAIRLANDTEYGLSAYFFTRDLARTWRVAEALEVGQIGINTGITAFEGAPFGGVKASGIGREGSHHSIDEFLELKYLCLGDMN
ncbi:NAD-dependent succinate-semialdehyde dehydrogenase [Brucella anthropi]|jgi:succinate-semialdehyde dehydrogenase/glutarate-semialdehyde dehydrogenase|uniref:NAD-dependent succinate-semialdehyde dehydrogenase n=1 Tax=Brucella anthropi TaxID=529 RepID=UPI00077525EE|nr:NAD-dependent succinate-semialdehyde dehydrogenase [Brucella anthropi]KXO72983.1 NAD-dependent succinate-semialdehyde dehydrogenase [Brucella anthropi]